MPVFAGYVSATDTGREDEIAKRCRQAIDLDTGEEHDTSDFQSGNFYISYAERGISISSRDNVNVFVLGHPIVSSSESAQEDADAIATAIAQGEDHIKDMMNDCRGNFSAVCWDGNSKTGYLTTDILATRPIYYMILQDKFIFSSCLKYFNIICDNLTVDTDGIMQEVAFGYCLGLKTPYQGIAAADAASISLLKPGKPPVCTAYWKWRSAEVPTSENLEDLAGDLFKSLQDAVHVRARRFPAQYCMLSGGMDSRLIAFLMLEEGHAPTTISFGDEVSCDQVIARAVAKLVSSQHIEERLDVTNFEFAGGTGGILSQVLKRHLPEKQRTTAVWSGDGGSVGLGGVYLTEAFCRHLDKHEFEAAGREFMSHNRGVAPRILSNRDYASKFFLKQFENEVSSFKLNDMMQSAYRFLLLNDQRRHMYSHYEEVCGRRVELVTPFFDSRFLKTMLSCPTVDIMFHRIYNRVFQHLPPSARSVAWQTYPGHQPCPLPLPKECQSQWGRSLKKGDKAAIRERCLLLLQGIMRKAWPGHLLDRTQCALAAAACLLGYDGASYLVNQASRVYSQFHHTR